MRRLFVATVFDHQKREPGLGPHCLRSALHPLQILARFLVLFLALVLSACSGASTGHDNIPPAELRGFTATGGNGYVGFDWLPPVGDDFAPMMIRRSLTNYPTSPTDGTVVYDGHVDYRFPIVPPPGSRI